MLKVEVLGTGCPKCMKLYEETKRAITQSGVAADLVKIDQIDEIAKRGVMRTPALVIDGEVRASGRIPAPDEIVEWLVAATGGNTSRRGSSTAAATSEPSSKPHLPTKAVLRALLLLFVFGSIGFLVYRGASANTPPSPDRATVTAAASSQKLVAYYFHRTKRCDTCRAIESQSKAALEAAFRDDLVAGRLEWKTVNLDEPANEHYIREYNVSWSSLVLAETKDSRTVRFKALEKTWDLVSDRSALAAYVQAEARSWLGGR